MENTNSINVPFTLYDTTTGRIEIVGIGPESFLQNYITNTNQKILLQTVDPNSYYIENGEPVLLPPKPQNPYVVFDYVTKTWKDPRTAETEWQEVRKKRNILLQESDWTQMPDVAMPTKSAWATYRQQLRDITTQADPFNIVWPTPPGD